MQAPLEIASRDFTLTDPLKDHVDENATELEQFYDRITSCHVTIESPEHDHHNKGKVFRVRILLNVPGKQLVVNRHSEEDFYMAVRDSFRAMRRELEDYAREQRGDVKAHAEQPRASVTQVFPEADYGFLITDDGTEVYFHRNSVLNADFDDVTAGMRVHFVEEAGEKGPQASTVRVIGKA